MDDAGVVVWVILLQIYKPERPAGIGDIDDSEYLQSGNHVSHNDNAVGETAGHDRSNSGRRRVFRRFIRPDSISLMFYCVFYGGPCV